MLSLVERVSSGAVDVVGVRDDIEEILQLFLIQFLSEVPDITRIGDSEDSSVADAEGSHLSLVFVVALFVTEVEMIFRVKIEILL